MLFARLWALVVHSHICCVKDKLFVTVTYSCQHPPPTPTIPAPVYTPMLILFVGVVVSPIVVACSGLGMLAQCNTHTHTQSKVESTLYMCQSCWCASTSQLELHPYKPLSSTHMCHLQNICVPLYGTVLSSLRFVCGSDVECTTRQLSDKIAWAFIGVGVVGAGTLTMCYNT